jgi:hypothetical protein
MLSNIIYTNTIFYEYKFVFLHKNNSNECAFNKYTLVVKPQLPTIYFYNERTPHDENRVENTTETNMMNCNFASM